MVDLNSFCTKAELLVADNTLSMELFISLNSSSQIARALSADTIVIVLCNNFTKPFPQKKRKLLFAAELSFHKRLFSQGQNIRFPKIVFSLFGNSLTLEQACPLLSGSTYRSEPEASSKEQDKTPGQSVGKIKRQPECDERRQLYYLQMRASYCQIRQLLIFCKISDAVEIEGRRGNQHAVIGPKTSPCGFLSMLSPNMASKM